MTTPRICRLPRNTIRAGFIARAEHQAFAIFHRGDDLLMLA